MIKAMRVVKGQRHTVDSAPIDLSSFLFTPIGPTIPEIQLFKNLTLKIQGRGFGQDHKSTLKRVTPLARPRSVYKSDVEHCFLEF